MKSVERSNIYKEEVSRVEAVVEKNVEQFRFEASEAFTAFDDTQRKWIKALGGTQAAAANFYEKYLSEFRPLVMELIDKPTNAVFIKELKKQLRTDDTTAVATITDLIGQRKQQAIREFVAPMSARVARRAEELLALPLDELDGLYASFRAYAVYDYASHKLSIPVFDPHASLLRRTSLRRRIQRERRKRDKTESERLSYLAWRMQRFEQQEGDIASLLVEKNLDLMLILAARNSYEKAQHASVASTAKEKIEQMRLFETSVTKLVEQYMSAFIKQRNAVSLQEIHEEEANLKTLLLRIFELDTVAKNRLVASLSEYKKFYDESQQIRSIQSERAVFVLKEA